VFPKLLEKLKTFGIHGILLTRIQDLLLSRKMRVGVRGSISLWIDFVSGVPQGSGLGQLPFLLFVSEIPH